LRVFEFGGHGDIRKLGVLRKKSFTKETGFFVTLFACFVWDLGFILPPYKYFHSNPLFPVALLSNSVIYKIKYSLNPEI
jgi:hypothetical protein